MFVAGVQRSGTNMVMDLLEADLATEVFHETDHRAFDNYELRTPAPLSVPKALCEGQDVRYLLDQFSGSRCLWVYRHYEDVARPHARKWAQMPDTIRRLCDKQGDIEGRSGRGMPDATRAVLRAHWHEDLNNEPACAPFWYFRNQHYFGQCLSEDPRVRLLGYETLLEHPHDNTEALYDFAGLDYLSRAGQSNKAPESTRRAYSDSIIDTSVRKLCDEMFARLRSETQLGAIKCVSAAAPKAAS
ncbi:sulfotransferase family protein [Salinisphaera aquimarina]|uniref:Sulfotransferase family protein n=1 Tax=Salinisphaera aquimarina TaxID=2094031 RepID=A0ABV7EPZ7_9GAMM